MQNFITHRYNTLKNIFNENFYKKSENQKKSKLLKSRDTFGVILQVMPDSFKILTDKGETNEYTLKVEFGNNRIFFIDFIISFYKSK